MCARHVVGGGGATGADLSYPSNSIRGSQNAFHVGLAGGFAFQQEVPTRILARVRILTMKSRDVENECVQRQRQWS